MKTLRLILGDQLNLQHSWFQQVDAKVVYCLFEMRQETDYVVHHIQKVVGFFLAMRHFAASLKEAGHRVIYYTIDHPENRQKLPENLQQLIKQEGIQQFDYQLPDEYRLDEQLKSFCQSLSISSQAYDTEHFFTSRNELSSFFKGKKQLLMESFYRYMRKKHQILMEDAKQPEGGKWNYDKSNRKKWKGEVAIPKAILFPKEVSELVTTIQQAGIKTIGRIDEQHFTFPISQEESLQQLDYFCNHLLVYFGDYQDAMHTHEHFLFHSRLSFALNCKIIAPKTVIDRVIQHYRTHEADISITQVEGFVRQIIGWREYMRGIYWKEMPHYAQLNVLENDRPLPQFFWTGQTKMNCLKQAINNSLDHAYAHHIQRLMVTGNFALLVQVHPDEVDQWYLGIYLDAIEWVEITNTRGMSQFADGGIVATKPYVSSAAYLHKMGNYCLKCVYDKKKRVGEQACPFNSLYWNFLDDKKQHFAKNNRMSMMLSLLRKIPSEELAEIKARAYQIIENPDAF
ncbi:MAG: cryptochrome/photolyase family protein [Flammeovirgaceae bacterium]